MAGITQVPESEICGQDASDLIVPVNIVSILQASTTLLSDFERPCTPPYAIVQFRLFSDSGE